MQAMRESWTDERLDDFADHVNRRFDEVGRRFDEVGRRLGEVDRRIDSLERHMDKALNRLGDGLESVQRMMVYGVVALSGAFVAGFAALVGLIATTL